MRENPSEATIDENPKRRIWEGEHWVAILDKYPLVEGHSLILPKKEIDHITKMSKEQEESMGHAISEVASILKRTYGEGVLVSIKCGKGSARTISHLHIHVIPRIAGDRLWNGDSSKIVIDRTSGFDRLEPTEEELFDVAKKIRGDE